ncbi:MAG: YchJ family metal-binding protein [Thiovulaceae bacterium]|nr:YchJ family metal-binding protein [Sulfurimonadaceae bacterium]MCW9026847.1 YchJ family metal-binding protein [Sulfurimonadaceae bacterium]
MKKIDTPQELMESRYEAFKRMDGEYLAKTTTQKISSDMSGYENIEWLKLDVLDAKDDEVEFKAYYRDNGIVEVLHERSKFVKVDDEWLYDSGVLFNTKIQRNEICPCGSGRKYKKCCA